MAQLLHKVTDKLGGHQKSEDLVGHSKTQYNDVASHYHEYQTFEKLPQSVLENQLVKIALDEIGVQGKHVLDLGGGSGVHARKILEAGAASVDLVDVSSEMLKEAEKVEEQLGRKDAMRFFVSDAAADLSHLGLRPQYDMVMLGWLFDHAHTDNDLNGFWRNIVTHTKPGGTIVTCRVVHPKSASCTTKAHYGLEFKDIRTIPGGLAYQVHFQIPDSHFDFGATTMDRSTGLVPVMYEEHGFIDLKRIPFEAAPTVKEDPASWKVFLEDPFFSCEYARKK